jgi:hypothetical protein
MISLNLTVGRSALGRKHYVAAVGMVGQRGRRLDLECDFVEGTEIFEDDFEVDVKVAGQFVGMCGPSLTVLSDIWAIGHKGMSGGL